jgi:hypothetical protein
VAVEVLAGAVVAHGGARVSVAGGDLNVAQADAGVEHGGDEGVAQHVGVHLRRADAGGVGQVFEPAGGRVPVHPYAEGVTQDRAAVAVVGGSVESSGHRGRERDQDDFAALAAHAQDSVPCFSPRSPMLAPQASKIRNLSRPSMAIRPKSFGLVDSRAVVIWASNCK